MKLVRINDLDNAEKLLYRHNREIGREISDEELNCGIKKFLEKGEVLGYIDKGKIVAMLNLYCNNHETLSAYICNVFVLKEYRGCRYSETLFEKAIAICKKNQFKNIRLHVSIDNHVAIHIYKKIGFNFTGEKNSVGDYEMKLDLLRSKLDKKKIMILGAGNAQLNLIIEAKKLDYYVIVCDNRSFMTGSIMADKYYQIDYMKKEEIIGIAKKERPNGIISNSEPAMPIVAEISQLLNLRGNTIDSIETLISKSRFRDLQKRIGVFCPEHFEVSSKTELLKIAENIQYPIIIKPSESCGTQGTTRLDEYDEELVENAFELCYKLSRNRLVSIEQYISMNSLRVNDIDVFIIDNDIIWDGWLWEDRSKEEPMLPMTEIFPMVLPDEQIEKIKATILKIIKGANIAFGEYNVETFFTESGEVFVIEMNPRQAGNYIPQLIEQHTGVNLSKLLVSVSVNDMRYYNYLKTFDRTNNFVTLQVVFSKNSGVLKEIYIDPEIKDYVLWIEQVIPLGCEVKKGKNGFDAIAFVDMQFEDYETQHRFTDNIENYIYPILEN